MAVRLIHGDVLQVLSMLPEQSVHCIVTSPPYWGLRSYLPAHHPDKHLEIGSEPTVHDWVRKMVQVFREARRVLRDDGIAFVNLGDNYAGSRQGPQGDSPLAAPGHQGGGAKRRGVQRQMVASARRDDHPVPRSDLRVEGLKPKDMVGQPWRLAFALQEDGWWIRNEIIWAKRNPMPESARDRFTKSHETVFMLSKSQRYYFDFESIQEQASETTHQRRAGTGVGFGRGFDANPKPRVKVAEDKVPSGWATGTDRSHEELAGRYSADRATPKAQASNDGAYADGKSERLGREPGWRAKNNASFDKAMAVMPEQRQPRDVRFVDEDEWVQFQRWKREQGIVPDVRLLSTEPFKGAHYATYPQELIEPFIKAGCPVGGVVLDPFGGSGTTGLVCDRLSRDAILIDLDARNMPMAQERITGGAPLTTIVTVEQVA